MISTMVLGSLHFTLPEAKIECSLFFPPCFKVIINATKRKSKNFVYPAHTKIVYTKYEYNWPLIIIKKSGHNYVIWKPLKLQLSLICYMCSLLVQIFFSIRVSSTFVLAYHCMLFIVFADNIVFKRCLNC